jgi:hypothetical protein
MHLQQLQILSWAFYRSNLKARIIRQRINNNRLNLLIPCIYPIHWLLGLLGSFFFKKRYSAIWFQTPITSKLLLLNMHDTEKFKRNVLLFEKRADTPIFASRMGV